MKGLVLWDIDHTLMTMRGTGSLLFGAAFERVTGAPMVRQATPDGLTDLVIFRETARLHGITTTPDDEERFAAALGQAHRHAARVIRERGHALPGAAPALAAIAALEGLHQTVVTGNVKAAAEVKLSVFGLDVHIEWDVGAYGEDSATRTGLVHTALRRADSRWNDAVGVGNVVLIGDTPADMEGAQSHGVPAVGVATGRSSATELVAAGAVAVLSDLTDTEAVMGLLRRLLHQS